MYLSIGCGWGIRVTSGNYLYVYYYYVVYVVLLRCTLSYFVCMFCVWLCFIDPKVRKIRNEVSSCPGIFSRTLRFYYVTDSHCSPLPHLLDRHRKLVGCSTIPVRSCPGPVWYHWGSVIELEALKWLPMKHQDWWHSNPTTPTYYKVSHMLNHHTHPTGVIQDKKTNVFDTSMPSPPRHHNFTVRVSHRFIITATECGRSRHSLSLGALSVQYPGL